MRLSRSTEPLPPPHTSPRDKVTSRSSRTLKAWRSKVKLAVVDVPLPLVHTTPTPDTVATSSAPCTTWSSDRRQWLSSWRTRFRTTSPVWEWDSGSHTPTPAYAHVQCKHSHLTITTRHNYVILLVGGAWGHG